ncbi:MAG: epoxyqueuosine reductase QueH [Candidatus Omnitrophica bacterium]|nr:epoxyqueuosine reductase QueH [Candidatus Omnitrophota bacterium]
MKILLHVCCAPCAIHPFRELIKNSANEVTGFFYNPNIHPAEEEKRRRQALTEYAKKDNFGVIFGEYNAEEFFRKVGDKQESPLRCGICWRLRLEKTAETAKSAKFDAFTTTLLVSPYQNQDMIKEIGADCGRKFGVQFIAVDFRGGFRDAQAEARNSGIYRQKYCGCVYSQKER